MGDYFEEAPLADTLTPSQAEVLGELRKMLGALNPSQVVVEQTRPRSFERMCARDVLGGLIHEYERAA